jgi:phage baseplate assembly protein W
MAYQVKQINPLDLKKSVGIGVNIPFSGRAVFNTTYTSKDAIRANIINFLLTNKNERVFNNNFGADIRSFIFEMIDIQATDGLQRRLTDLLQFYFPNITVTSLTVSGEADQNTVYINLSYALKSYAIEDNFTIAVTNG